MHLINLIVMYWYRKKNGPKAQATLGQGSKII